MASVSISTDFNNANTVFMRKQLPGSQDLRFKAAPAIQAFIASAAKGTRELVVKAGDFNKFAKRPRSEMIRGAKQFRQAVRYASLGGGRSYTGIVAKTYNKTEFETNAQWDLTFGLQELTIPQDDWMVAHSAPAGEYRQAAMLGLIQLNTENGYDTLFERLESEMLGTGTSAATALLSLVAGIGASATDTTTYGSISRSSNTWWRGNYSTGTLSSALDPTNASYIRKKMRTMVNTVKNNGARVNDLMFFMPTNLHEKYQDSLDGLDVATTIQPQLTRRQQDSGKEIVGFEGLYFNNVPIVEVPNMTAGRLLLIDTASTIVTVLANSGAFVLKPWEMSEQATKVYSQIDYAIQTVVTNPRRNFHIAYS